MSGDRSTPTKSTVEYINAFYIRPTVLCRDIEKSFLQIRIRDLQGRLKVLLVSNLDLNKIDVSNFTRLIFGLTKSRFTLECKLKVHINN